MDEREYLIVWFSSDMPIPFEVKKGKKKGILILESNASYYNGKKYGGDKRFWIYVGDSSDDLYHEVKKIINFDLLRNIVEVSDDIESLSNNGFKVRLLD